VRLAQGSAWNGSGNERPAGDEFLFLDEIHRIHRGAKTAPLLQVAPALQPPRRPRDADPAPRAENP